MSAAFATADSSTSCLWVTDEEGGILIIFTVRARNMVVEVEHESCGPMKLLQHPVKFSAAQPKVRSAPPTLGQHTNEILAEMLDMNDQEIESLRKDGVVA
jgi:succinate---hydroxymethylglutarate CoA-transferase